jgi:ElaB/YqjD/DUF883 family membrane-anchored ribosome-binding protein
MDEQRAKVSDAAGKVGDTVSDLARQTRTGLEDKLDQGRAVLKDVQASAGEAVEKATALAHDVSAAAGQAAAQAGEIMQGAARDVGTQAEQAAQAVYQQGARAGGYLSRYAAEQPLSALLVAGAIGYGLAYLIHRS